MARLRVHVHNFAQEPVDGCSGEKGAEGGRSKGGYQHPVVREMIVGLWQVKNWKAGCRLVC